MTKQTKNQICMVVYTDYRFDARVRREAETLAEAGFEVTCLTPRTESSCQDYQLRGVHVHELNVDKYQGKSQRRYLASYLKFLLAASVACSSLLAKGRIDAVHVHNLPDFLVAAGLLPRLFGKPVVLDIHDSIPETYGAKFPQSSGVLQTALRWEERLSTMLATRVICVNHPQQEVLQSRGLAEGKSFVSMNVPDHRLFHQNGPNANNGDGSFKLIYHGTMASRLGVDIILRAVDRIGSEIPNLQLHLWGYGDDLEGFQALAKELQIDDRVHFEPKGYPVHELPDRLTAMDVGVVGNRRDCATELMLPVKLLEYVALGIPVIAPRLRTINHYFSDDMVAFYESENVDSLAESILRLHRSRESRIEQAKNASRFLDEFGWEKQGPELIQMYQSMLSGVR